MVGTKHRRRANVKAADVEEPWKQGLGKALQASVASGPNGKAQAYPDSVVQMVWRKLEASAL